MQFEISTKFAFVQRRLFFPFLLFVFFVCIGKSASPGEFRTWTSSGGGKLYAELVAVSEDGQTVTLRGKSGKEDKGSLAKLSKEDQEYVQKRYGNKIASAVAGTANTTKELQEVIATGLGANQDAALKNAWRNAVSQAVGSHVSAERLVENDELVRNEILTLSDGFVESYDVIGNPTNDEGGLVEVRIKAKVRRTELGTQLLKAGVNPDIRFDSKGLAAELQTKEDTREDAMVMLERLLNQFPENVLETSLTARPKYDLGSKKVVLEIVTKVNKQKYSAFTKELATMLQRVGGKAEGTIIARLERREKQVRGSEPEPEVGLSSWTAPGSSKNFPKNKYGFFIAENWPNFTRTCQKITQNFAVYTVPEDVFGMIRPMFDLKNMVVKVSDNDSNVLSVGKAKALGPSFNAQSWVSGYFVFNMRKPNVVCLFPAIYTGHGAYEIQPGTLEYKQQVLLDISREDMEKISDTLQIVFE